MDNKIDTWKVVLVDFTDLPIDRIARIGGGFVVLLTSDDREASSRGSPVAGNFTDCAFPDIHVSHAQIVVQKF